MLDIKDLDTIIQIMNPGKEPFSTSRGFTTWCDLRNQFVKSYEDFAAEVAKFAPRQKPTDIPVYKQASMETLVRLNNLLHELWEMWQSISESYSLSSTFNVPITNGFKKYVKCLRGDDSIYKQYLEMKQKHDKLSNQSLEIIKLQSELDAANKMYDKAANQLSERDAQIGKCVRLIGKIDGYLDITNNIINTPGTNLDRVKLEFTNQILKSQHKLSDSAIGLNNCPTPVSDKRTNDPRLFPSAPPAPNSRISEVRVSPTRRP